MLVADKRAYFKLDVGYMSNPKVLAVLDESSGAILLHIASIAYAAQHLTDGVVPVKALLRMTGAKESDAALLVTAGLWVDGPEGGKAEIHDYLEHQRSATEVKGATDKAKRAAGARWEARADASSNATSNAFSNASSMPDAMPDASESAMPREEREERERKSKSGVEDAAPPSRSLALVQNRSDVDAICDHLAEAIESIGAKKPTVTTKWRTEARLMLDKDGRTAEEVHGCIRWLFSSNHTDAIWWRAGRIGSMQKLREKFDALRLQAQSTRGGSRQQETDALFERAAQRMGVNGSGA